MSLDPYAPCPGGTGKKIKFCCPDLVGDLEKWMKDGKLNNVSPGEPKMGEADVKSFLHASKGK